jgi:RsiW-degrading membrane proteinase PrsW (M82 family)
MLINAVFFHILPFVVKKKYSPGLASAVVLFLPLGIWLFYGADKDGVMSAMTVVGAFVLGAGLMAYPILLLKVKDKPFFKQD